MSAMAELTDSPKPSTNSLTVRPALRVPQTIEEARALREWADAQPNGVTPATTQQLAGHLSYIAAALPRQAADEITGKKRTVVYARILGSYSNEALAYLARTACETLEWFPTPKKCLDILATFTPAPGDKDKALSLCQQFWQSRFEQFAGSLRDGTAQQADVDAVPEQWRRIAVERGYLRCLGEGRYVIRKPE